MKKRGHDLIFLGGRSTQRTDFGAFNQIFYLPINSGLRIGIDPSVKKKWIRKIEEIKPDLIHANNIIVASFLLGTEYPVVYDDHEYWSHNRQMLITRGLIRNIANRPLYFKIPGWEDQLLRKYPVITVSEAIAKEHRERAPWVGVIHNYPFLFEVEHLKSPKDRKGIVFVGWDYTLPKFKPYRDLTGLNEILEFDVLTGLPHDELMKKLTQYKIGLNAYIPHPWHKYSDANKTYEYLHAGLQVVANYIIAQSLPDEKYMHSFRDYSEIKSVVDSILDVDSDDVMQQARKRYVWDIQEATLETAYKKALS